jgi:hypothetical protein
MSAGSPWRGSPRQPERSPEDNRTIWIDAVRTDPGLSRHVVGPPDVPRHGFQAHLTRKVAEEQGRVLRPPLQDLPHPFQPLLGAELRLLGPDRLGEVGGELGDLGLDAAEQVADLLGAGEPLGKPSICEPRRSCTPGPG